MATKNFSNKLRKRQRGDSGDEDSDSDVEQAPNGESTWPRFLVISSRDPERPLKNLHPFLVGKTIENRTGKPEAKRIGSDLLVQVDTRSKSVALQKLENIGDCPVAVSPHRTLNSSRGVIRDWPLAQLSETELKKHLRKQGVTAVKRFQRQKGEMTEYSPTVILTFGVPTLPEKIHAGYYWVKVAPFIPFPLRCFQCQAYGHGASRCRKKTPVCSTCGEEGHQGPGCDRPPRCVNCEGPHPANSRQCRIWKRESEIQRLRVEFKVSFPEARKMYERSYGGIQNEASQQRSYSRVVGGQNQPKPETADKACDPMPPFPIPPSGRSWFSQFPAGGIVPFAASGPLTPNNALALGAVPESRGQSTPSSLSGVERGEVQDRPSGHSLQEVVRGGPSQHPDARPETPQGASCASTSPEEGGGRPQPGNLLDTPNSGDPKSSIKPQPAKGGGGVGPRGDRPLVAPKPTPLTKAKVPPDLKERPKSAGSKPKEKEKERSKEKTTAKKKPEGPKIKPQKGDSGAPTSNRFEGLADEAMDTSAAPTRPEQERLPPTPTKKK